MIFKLHHFVVLFPVVLSFTWTVVCVYYRSPQKNICKRKIEKSCKKEKLHRSITNIIIAKKRSCKVAKKKACQEVLQKNHCKKEKLQKDDWICYKCNFLIQISYSNSNSLVNLYCFLIQYLRGTEDRCNLVSHYQRVSNQFQLVCSVWLWELCEKSLFLRSNKKLLSIWFCKCFLAAKICTGALGQIWKMRLWRGGDCSKSTSTKFWTSETVRLREELNLYRG